MASPSTYVAPLRRVIARRRGDTCERITFPNGDVAIVCGPRPYFDRLECGHEGTYYAPAAQRRCKTCLASYPTVPDDDDEDEDDEETVWPAPTPEPDHEPSHP